MDKKQCYLCKETKVSSDFSKNSKNKDGLHSYCKPCFNSQNRSRLAIWRKKKGKEYYHAYNQRPTVTAKITARRKLNNAITIGKLTRESCSNCGVENAEAHHYDYSLPLNVWWLCKQHHEDLHHKINIK